MLRLLLGVVVLILVYAAIRELFRIKRRKEAEEKKREAEINKEIIEIEEETAKIAKETEKRKNKLNK